MGFYNELRKIMKRNSDKDFRLEENFGLIQNEMEDKGYCLMPVSLIDYLWPFEKEHGQPLSYNLPRSNEEIYEFNYAHVLGIDVKNMRKCSSLSFSQKEMEDFLRLYNHKRAGQVNSFQDPDVYKKYIRRIGFGKSNAFWSYIIVNEGVEPLGKLIEKARAFSRIGWLYSYMGEIPEDMVKLASYDKAYAKALKDLFNYAPLTGRTYDYCDEITGRCIHETQDSYAWRLFDIRAKLVAMKGNKDVYEDVFKACNGDLDYMRSAFLDGRYQSWFKDHEMSDEDIRKYWPYRYFLSGKETLRVPAYEKERAIKIAHETFPAKMAENFIRRILEKEDVAFSLFSYRTHDGLFTTHDAFVLTHGLKVGHSWQEAYAIFVAAFLFGETTPSQVDLPFNEEEEMEWVKDLHFWDNRGWIGWYLVTHRDWYPEGCDDENPQAFNFKAFMEACKLVGIEPKSLTADLALPMMRLTSAMGSEFKRYTEKYYLDEKSDWRTAIHDAGQSFEASVKLNKEWRDTILKLGPEAAKASNTLLEFERVPRSLKELRNTLAHIQYGDGFPEELIQVFLELKLPKYQAEKYKAWLEENPVKNFESCPDIDITIDGYRFRKLQADDLRGPLLGVYTNCCQHPQGAGAECARHGWNSGYGAFYVVEHKGKIIGQSWAWRGGRKKLLGNPFRPDPFVNDSPLNTLCFDNIELLSDTYGSTVLKLYTEAARRFLGQLGIERVTVGLGYNDLQELEKLQDDRYHAEPVDYDGYRDSHDQKVLYTMLE